MREVSALVAAGQLVPVIDEVVPFARIADAHERIEGGHARGKVVITMPCRSDWPLRLPQADRRAAL